MLNLVLQPKLVFHSHHCPLHFIGEKKISRFSLSTDWEIFKRYLKTTAKSSFKFVCLAHGIFQSEGNFTNLCYMFRKMMRKKGNEIPRATEKNCTFHNAHIRVKKALCLFHYCYCKDRLELIISVSVIICKTVYLLCKCIGQ